jgi:hypothetical protein
MALHQMKRNAYLVYIILFSLITSSAFQFYTLRHMGVNSRNFPPVSLHFSSRFAYLKQQYYYPKTKHETFTYSAFPANFRLSELVSVLHSWISLFLLSVRRQALIFCHFISNSPLANLCK